MAKILVVEDNRANQRLFRDTLTRVGHSVVVASDAAEGLRLTHEFSFDLVVMDIQLPGMDGIEATRALRADVRSENIVILAVSAHAMRGDETRILSAGCNAYLSKPVRHRQLTDTVDNLLKLAAG